jgi:hypothetical protein
MTTMDGWILAILVSKFSRANLLQSILLPRGDECGVRGIVFFLVTPQISPCDHHGQVSRSLCCLVTTASCMLDPFRRRIFSLLNDFWLRKKFARFVHRADVHDVVSSPHHQELSLWLLMFDD